jgi:hypothetical protein
MSALKMHVIVVKDHMRFVFVCDCSQLHGEFIQFNSQQYFSLVTYLRHALIVLFGLTHQTLPIYHKTVDSV